MIAACVAVSSLGGKQEKDPPFDLVPAESSSDDVYLLLPPVRCGAVLKRKSACLGFSPPDVRVTCRRL